MALAAKVTLLIALAAVALLLYCVPCRIAVLVSVGRSQCTWNEAIAPYRARSLPAPGPPNHLRVVREEDDGCELWESDEGKGWVPRGSRFFTAFPFTSLALTRYRTLDSSGEILVHPGDVVLDCGGFIGDSAAEALALGARLVVSIEPSARNLACLRRNLAKQIRDGRVIVVEKGVWDREDTLVLKEVPGDSSSDHIAVPPPAPGSRERRVPLTTIDKLVEELKLERVDFIKMDIEGAEQRALIGARTTLAKYRPRLVLAAYHLPDDTERIPALVKSAWPGYRTECGQCSLEGWRIRPRMFYFH